MFHSRARCSADPGWARTTAALDSNLPRLLAQCASTTASAAALPQLPWGRGRGRAMTAMAKYGAAQWAMWLEPNGAQP